MEVVVPENKRRKSGVSEDGNGRTDVARRQSRATTYNSLPPLPPGRASGFTPVNPTGVAGVSRSSMPGTLSLTQSPPQSPNLKEIKLTMRYRGKLWHFNSIAHKAKVFEQILLQEEKDVESYPVLAFAKGAKKAAAFGGEDDFDREESALKDYFRMYTHFMHERFPGNEKILLENGAKPSAN